MKKFIANLRSSQPKPRAPATPSQNLIPGINPKLKGLLRSKLRSLLPESLLEPRNESTLKKPLEISGIDPQAGRRGRPAKGARGVDPFLYLNLKYLSSLKNAWVLRSFSKIIREDADWPALLKRVFRSQAHIRNQRQHENIFHAGVLVFIFLKLFTQGVKTLFFGPAEPGRPRVLFRKANGYSRLEIPGLEALAHAPRAQRAALQNLFLLQAVLEALARNLGLLKTNLEQFTKIYLVKDLAPFYREYRAIFAVFQEYSRTKLRAARARKGGKPLRDEISRIIEDTEQVALSQCKGFCCLKKASARQFDQICPHQCKAHFRQILEAHWKLFSLTALERSLRLVKEDARLRAQLQRALRAQRSRRRILPFAEFHRLAQGLFELRLRKFLQLGKAEGARPSKRPRSPPEERQALLRAPGGKENAGGQGAGRLLVPESAVRSERDTQRLIFRKLFCYSHNLRRRELRAFEEELFPGAPGESGAAGAQVARFYCLKLYSEAYLDFLRKVTAKREGRLEALRAQLGRDEAPSAEALRLVEAELAEEEGAYEAFLGNLRVLREEVDQESLEVARLRAHVRAQGERLRGEDPAPAPRKEAPPGLLAKVLAWKRLEHFQATHALNRKLAALAFALEKMRRARAAHFRELRSALERSRRADSEGRVFDFSSFFEWLMLQLLRLSETEAGASAKTRIDAFVRARLAEGAVSLANLAPPPKGKGPPQTGRGQVAFFLRKKLKELQVFLVSDCARKHAQRLRRREADARARAAQSALEKKARQLKELRRMKAKRLLRRRTQVNG